MSLIKMVTYPVDVEESPSPGDKRDGGIRLNSQLSLVLRFRMCTAVPSFPLHVLLTWCLSFQFPVVTVCSTGFNTKSLF